MTCTAFVMTPRTPGAIGVIHITGASTAVVDLLHALTAHAAWPLHRARWSMLADLDDGVCARLRDDLAVVMPHGGMRVMQRLLEWMRANGAVVSDPNAMPMRNRFPEARTERAAALLDLLARARSPRAVDVLLRQVSMADDAHVVCDADRAWSARIRHLIDPPLVVVAGPANVGKSTLTNTLMGRAQSIAFDQPGTTRDYTMGFLDLDGVVVHWLDTPGVRETSDAIEARAIELAQQVMRDADVLIALTDTANEWPALPRAADLRVGTRSDLGVRNDADLTLSAKTGEGMRAFVSRVRSMLVSDEDLAAARWLVMP
ncbi:MAG: 50S ribosome-binding GTPase [Phycisphaerales bacterium]|nr:50S ribosome-binding GTPase [Phycisphaerales bacterium]